MVDVLGIAAVDVALREYELAGCLVPAVTIGVRGGPIGIGVEIILVDQRVG
jgi:hypothetical protein